jgi:hypothetical protein
MKKKLAFGEISARGRQKKRLHEELAREIHDGKGSILTGSEEEDN